MHKLTIKTITFLLLVAGLFAQTGKISGVVKDKATGEALPGVNVSVDGTQLGASTDVDGFYVILNVPVGRHSLKFSYVGYAEYQVNDLIVNIDNTTALDAEISEEVNVGDVVVVTAERALIRRSETNSRQIKNSEEIKNMPIRSVQDVVAITSGVVRRGNANEVNVRGGRLEDSAIMIDGVKTNNSSQGTSSTRLNKNAIEEVTVQSGGFGAEFGGVMSGLIQTTTKTGSSKYNVVFEAVGDGVGSERGDEFLGTAVNGYRNLNLSVGGPIIPGTNNHFFFVSADMLWENDDRPSWGGEAIGLDYTNKYSEREALNLVFNYKANIGDNMSIRLGGTYDDITNIPYGAAATSRAFNLGQGSGHTRSYFGDKAGHRELIESTNLTGNLTFTHTLDKNTYYNIKFGMLSYERERMDSKYRDNFRAYGDLELNRFKGDPHDFESARKYGDMVNEGDLAGDPGSVQGFTEDFGDEAFRLRRVQSVNRVFNAYGRDKEDNWQVSFDFFKKLDKHQIKIGAGYKTHTLRTWYINPALLSRNLDANGQPVQDYDTYYPRLFQGNYGYNIFGEEVDNGDYLNGSTAFDAPNNNGADAPRKPRSMWFYASDEYVLDDFILTVGFRIDHFDPNWINLVNPLDPVSGGTDPLAFDLGNTKESESYTEFQPRIGFAFPVDENTKFSANLSRLVQMPTFNRIYTEYDELWNDFSGQGNTLPNPNLAPEENTSYEISIAHQVSTDIALNVRTYYRTIKNLVQMKRIESTNPSLDHYFTNANSDFTDTKGVELSLETRRINNLRLFANYTFSSALGTGSTSNSNSRNIRDDSQEFVQFATSLEFDVPHQLNVNLDYRFFDGEGPSIGGATPFENMGVNLIYNVQSGRPYTERIILNSFREIDTRFAEIGSAVNSSRRPSISSFDLRVDKTFPLKFGDTNVDLNLYVDVQNLFNQENILFVQRSTGSVNEDGYLATAASLNDVETSNEYKRDSYRYLLNNPANWGAPRIMRIGLRFEF